MTHPTPLTKCLPCVRTACLLALSANGIDGERRPGSSGARVWVPSETGWSDGDLEEQYRSASWRVMLNKAQYTKVVAHIRKMQASSPVWQASLYNCNAFAADIARSMGFKTPAIWLRPQQFMTELREMNTAPIAADNAARTPQDRLGGSG